DVDGELVRAARGVRDLRGAGCADGTVGVVPRAARARQRGARGEWVAVRAGRRRVLRVREAAARERLASGGPGVGGESRRGGDSWPDLRRFAGGMVAVELGRADRGVR